MKHETASVITNNLGEISSDFQITERIGGTGLIAILQNGPGRTVMLRADMDALPVAKLTGLDYACQKQTKDTDGEACPVMHACGHDMYITALLAASQVLVLSRAKWCGTLVFLFQPAEEKLCGARTMVQDGLYEKHGCPIPDIVLAWHVTPHKAGCIIARPDLTMAAPDCTACPIRLSTPSCWQATLCCGCRPS
jgi:metal-dependent amidase/aminoacylase/carboxypeptidase family protein